MAFMIFASTVHKVLQGTTTVRATGNPRLALLIAHNDHNTNQTHAA